MRKIVVRFILYFVITLTAMAEEFFIDITKGREKYQTDDIVIPEVWRYVTDTSILLGNTVYKIEKLTNDTFIYSTSNRRAILSRASTKL